MMLFFQKKSKDGNVLLKIEMISLFLDLLSRDLDLEIKQVELYMDLKFRELIWDLDMDLGNFSRYYDK